MRTCAWDMLDTAQNGFLKPAARHGGNRQPKGMRSACSPARQLRQPAGRTVSTPLGRDRPAGLARAGAGSPEPGLGSPAFLPPSCHLHKVAKTGLGGRSPGKSTSLAAPPPADRGSSGPGQRLPGRLALPEAVGWSWQAGRRGEGRPLGLSLSGLITFWHLRDRIFPPSPPPPPHTCNKIWQCNESTVPNPIDRNPRHFIHNSKTAIIIINYYYWKKNSPIHPQPQAARGGK